MTRSVAAALALLLMATAAQPACAPAVRPSAATAGPAVVHVAPPTGEKDIDRASILAALEEVRPAGTVQFAAGTYLVGRMIRVTTPRITLLGHPDGTTLRGCEPEGFLDPNAMNHCNGLELAGERQAVRDLTIEYAFWALHLGCCFDERARYMLPDGTWEELPVIHRTAGGHLVEGNTFRSAATAVRVNGDWQDPAVVRGNRFLDNWHAVSINGHTVHLLNNHISAPEPEKVPYFGFAWDAISISPPLALQGASGPPACIGNVIGGNTIDGYVDGISVQTSVPGSVCRQNVIRDNTIRVHRAHNPSRELFRSSDATDSTVIGVPIALLHDPDAFGDAVTGSGMALAGNVIEGNRIHGAEGIAIEVRNASRNLITNNTIVGVRVREPYPGNTMGVRGAEGLPLEWEPANGSGIWISRGSVENEIVGNTFEGIAAHSVVLEGGRNRVETRSARNTVRDLGSGNRLVLSHTRGVDLPRTDDLLTSVQAIADSVLESGPTAGLSVGIARGDELLVARGFGHADAERAVPATGATVYGIGSISKLFAAVAILRLAEDGRLSLDDDVGRFLPAFAAQERVITVRHLLNHTSGTRSITDEPLWSVISRDQPHISPDSLAALIARQPLDIAPGTGFAYNNSGYFLLGLIVERVSGRSYEQYVEEAVLRPAGLAGTALCHGRTPPQRATGYTREDDRLVAAAPEIDVVLGQAAASLCSTVLDLIRLQRALVGGDLLRPESYAELTAPTRLAGGATVGSGYGLTSGQLAGRPVLHIDGFFGGFSAYYAYIPDDDLTVVVLANTAPEEPERIGERIARAALGLPDGSNVALVPDTAGRARLVGEYGPPDQPALVRIFEQDGELMAELPWLPASRLRHTAPGEFRPVRDPRVHLSFREAEGSAADVVVSYAASTLFLAPRVNQVNLRSVDDPVRDGGNGNRVTGSATPRGEVRGSASDTIRYVELIDGHIVGERLVWQEGPHRWGYSYTSGRWPWTRTERLVLDDDGLPVRLDVAGVMDIGVAWRERFERQDGTVRWFTPLERGEAPATAAYYPPIHPAHDLGVLARALLRRPAGTLPLLPTGEARVQPLGERTVAANGQSRTVRLYAIHGLELAPAYVWLDPDGATFAEEWSILAGWESVLPELHAATAAAAAEHRLELARTLVPAARTRPLVIRGARLFDAASGTVREGTTIIVHDKRIAAVGEDAGVAIPAGAEVIEAEGRMALPGLWDMHAHFSIPMLDRESHALLDLAAGVTTARDLAANVEAIVALRAAIDAGHAVGPRIVLAGYIDGAAGEKRGLGILVDSPESARAAVDRYAALGFAQVKTYNHLPAELVSVVVVRARERGLRVSGHIPFALMSGEAVAAGYDELHHLHMILGDITVRPIEAAAQGETWHTWYQVMAGMTPESPAVAEFIELLVARGVVVDPTLGLFASAGVPPDYIADALNRLPAQVRRRVQHSTAAYDMVPVHPLARPAWERTVANLSALLLALHRAGVPIVVGTDTWSGFGLHHEMALYVAAGIPAPDVLTLATLGAARVMRMDDQLGSIEPGKLADLILVDGDPTTDIRDIRRVVMVVKDGRVYDPAAIYRTLGIEPCCAK